LIALQSVQSNSNDAGRCGKSAVGLVPIAQQMLAGMKAGWTQSIDKLEELLARA
jgi:hypothetical protein